MGNRYIEVFKAMTMDFIKVNAGNIPQVERFLGQGSHAIGLEFIYNNQLRIYNILHKFKLCRYNIIYFFTRIIAL